MSQNTPTVTVLMPVFNAEKHLKEAIDSILNQDFTDFEFLIINDGSSDGSESIILSYDDSRIRYVKNETNLRLIATLNKGFDLARGKYIARMDADDISLPNRFTEQVKFMDGNPEVVVCGTWFQSMGDSNSVVKYPNDDTGIKFMALYQCPFCHPSVMLRTDALRDNQLKYSSEFPHAEDYEFWLRMSHVGKLTNLDQVLFQYRQHSESISRVESETQVRLSVEIRRSFFEVTGVKPSDQELDLFRKANYRHDDLALDELQVIQGTISCLLKANTESGFMNQDKLKSIVQNLWFNLCYNHAWHGMRAFRIYKGLKMYDSEYVTPTSILKFLVKCALRAGK